ncbi:DUF2553 family protein [Bacillus taeanensis]|uniref:DUF2553 family protein n=1 Tax=Bacillus taeanensis TaxID=273032 RepID=UPI0015F090CC
MTDNKEKKTINTEKVNEEFAEEFVVPKEKSFKIKTEKTPSMDSYVEPCDQGWC